MFSSLDHCAIVQGKKQGITGQPIACIAAAIIFTWLNDFLG